MRERTWTRLAAVLVVVVLGATAAACGTGGTKADVGESSASDDAVSGDPTSNDLEQMRERLNDLGAGELGDCMSVGLAYLTLTLGVGFGSLGAALGGDPEEMQATADELAELQDQIPDAIADDFETFRSAFEQMLAQLDIGEGETPNVLDPEFQEQLEEASAVLESPEVKEAQENIATFMEDECPDAVAGLGS